MKSWPDHANRWPDHAKRKLTWPSQSTVRPSQNKLTIHNNSQSLSRKPDDVEMTISDLRNPACWCWLDLNVDSSLTIAELIVAIKSWPDHVRSQADHPKSWADHARHWADHSNKQSDHANHESDHYQMKPTIHKAGPTIETIKLIIPKATEFRLVIEIQNWSNVIDGFILL